ncbi:hypothetical protein [Streptomyces sp. NPDC005876]|uniref:hypothetical protein n=1 Tax=unclassified Streptomyces TaxID=2593676 RepID=UPI00340E3D8D
MYLTGGARQDTDSAGPPKIRRAARRAARRLAVFSGYLESEDVGGGNVVCAHDRADNAVAFAQAVFVRGRSHFLHLRGVSPRPAQGRFEQVNIVTGPCLFSNRAVRFVDDLGQSVDLVGTRPRRITRRLTGMTSQPHLSLYEYESITRHSSLIADVASVLPAETRLTVTLDVPRVQYYTYLLDAFRDGLVDSDLAIRWFETVDARHALVLGALRRSLCDRLLHATPRAVPVTEADTLRGVGESIRQAVTGQGAPELGETLAILRSEDDPAWRLVLATQPPHDLAAVAGASYTVEELRAASPGESGGPTLGIAVENYMEWKIHDQASRVLRKLDTTHRSAGAPSLIGVYPLERFLSPSLRWGHLYYQDPGSRARDGHGHVIDLFERSGAV